jgi:hypothetical protein
MGSDPARPWVTLPRMSSSLAFTLILDEEENVS